MVQNPHIILQLTYTITRLLDIKRSVIRWHVCVCTNGRTYFYMTFTDEDILYILKSYLNSYIVKFYILFVWGRNLIVKYSFLVREFTSCLLKTLSYKRSLARLTLNTRNDPIKFPLQIKLQTTCNPTNITQVGLYVIKL